MICILHFYGEQVGRDSEVTYQELISGINKYGSTKNDICKHTLGVLPEQINTNVILAPWWDPSVLPSLGKAVYLSASDYSAVKIWHIENGDKHYTYIKTGIGAPVLMDVVLGLGLTECENIVFIGSVGALSKEIRIGDIVIPEYSVCGDGASRYIKNTSLINNDVFGERAYPDKELLRVTKNITNLICEHNNVNWHIGNNFSIDTIFAQFSHIDEIVGMGCNVIEMETAAAFEAASVAGIPMVALFSVSDNTVTKQSLVSGRTENDMAYRRFVRRELFPQIISEIFNHS